MIVSVHCHNDLGLATANTLAGIRAGARQAEVTINGIGERAGNTSLEEVVMALRTRQPLFGLSTGIDTTQLVATSKLVSQRTGIVVQPNKAIVGANAFAHEAGIHQDGMLKHEETYEIMRPETVGAAKTLLVLGKHSGRHAFARAAEASSGTTLEGEGLDAAFARFKVLADKKKRITDADLEALVSSRAAREDPSTACSKGCRSPAARAACRPPRCGCAAPTARFAPPPRSAPARSHAAFKAIDQIVKAPAELLEFSLSAITEGIDALGDASVRLRPNDRAEARVNPQTGAARLTFHGHAADTDVIVASTKAYLAALNRMLAATLRRSRVPTEQRATARSELAAGQHRRRRRNEPNEPCHAKNAVRESLDRARRRRGAGAARRSSTSTCTWSTRSRRRRPSPACASAGSRCAGPTAPSRRWTTRRRPCRKHLLA